MGGVQRRWSTRFKLTCGRSSCVVTNRRIISLLGRLVAENVDRGGRLQRGYVGSGLVEVNRYLPVELAGRSGAPDHRYSGGVGRDRFLVHDDLTREPLVRSDRSSQSCPTGWPRRPESG